MTKRFTVSDSAVFDASVNGMALTELDGGAIVDVNAQWVRAFGIDRERALGRTALELGLWVNREDRAVCLAELKQQGRVEAFEARLIMHGQELPHLLSAQLIEAGKRQLVLWEFRDISALKQAEGMRDYLAAIVDSSNDAIVSRDMQDRKSTR